MSVSPSGALLPFVHAAVARRDLSAEQALEAMRIVIRGGATDAQIAAFLVALQAKGETAEELAGFARAMREAALPVPFESAPGETLLDTCGTGGDGQNTFNISTTVAFVVAGCGVRVAKHGNRGVSSSSGSADVLESLGVTVAQSGQQAADALRKAGICFLFAPAFHPHLQQAQAVRRELKMRTVFNLLGPLSNPARTRAQIVGTASLDAACRVAEALAELGLERGFVLHGHDGLDELTLTGNTTVFEIRGGACYQTRLHPRDFHMDTVRGEDLRGGTPSENAQITMRVLEGESGPRRDIVIANAAMALIAAGAALTIDEGVERASASIDGGAALGKLRELRELTNS